MKWTEETALKRVQQYANITDKVIILECEVTPGTSTSGAISYLCNHCGYKLT